MMSKQNNSSMSNESNKPNKIYVNKQPRAVPSNSTIIKPTVEHILQDALDIVTNEIMKLKARSVHGGGSLNINEARVLQGYIKSLVELSKESRETRDSEDLANISDTELLTLIEQLKNRGSK